MLAILLKAIPNIINVSMIIYESQMSMTKYDQS